MSTLLRFAVRDGIREAFIKTISEEVEKQVAQNFTTIIEDAVAAAVAQYEPTVAAAVETAVTEVLGSPS